MTVHYKKVFSPKWLRKLFAKVGTIAGGRAKSQLMIKQTDEIPAHHQSRKTRRDLAHSQRMRCTRNRKFHLKRSGVLNTTNQQVHTMVTDKRWQWVALVQALSTTLLGAKHANI